MLAEDTCVMLGGDVDNTGLLIFVPRLEIGNVDFAGESGGETVALSLGYRFGRPLVVIEVAIFTLNRLDGTSINCSKRESIVLPSNSSPERFQN